VDHFFLIFIGRPELICQNSQINSEMLISTSLKRDPGQLKKVDNFFIANEEI